LYIDHDSILYAQWSTGLGHLKQIDFHVPICLCNFVQSIGLTAFYPVPVGTDEYLCILDDRLSESLRKTQNFCSNSIMTI
jgi:hypothetical protein